MYGLAAWKSWVASKNAELAGVSSSRNMKMISADLLSMNCEELNYALCLFLKDLRKKNGKLYQPDTVFYLLLGEYCTMINDKDSQIATAIAVFTRLFDFFTQLFYNIKEEKI